MSSNNMKEQKEDMDELLTLVTNVNIDDSKLRGQVIDQEKVNWYTEKFDMFVADNALGAIAGYLQKLQSENVNEITRMVIMHEALNRQLQK